MATNRNIKETGWFYHAPAKRQQQADPVLYPPMSQIPGLAEDDGRPDEPIKPLFRDTDTKYIRLAKQGGRANLLQMKENTEKREFVGYPRNDWFYLEDNALEDACTKQNSDLEYEFSRPEYMVHQPYKKDDASFYERPGRGPLGYDRLTAFEREGSRVSDKTVKLPELKKVGYGVRSGRPLRIPKNLQPEKKPPSAQTDPGKGPRPPRYLAMPSSPGSGEDRPKMGKILSYAYEREWQEDLNKWQQQQDVGREKHRAMTNLQPHKEEKVQSEYNIIYNKKSTVHSAANREDERAVQSQHSEGRKTVRQNEAQRLREACLKKPEEKDPFKMTRFKNIPARIESHRNLASQRQAQPAAC